MREYKQSSKLVVSEVLVSTTCDLCGVEAKRGEYCSSVYDVEETEVEVTVSKKDGYSCPDGGSGTEYVVDICPDCFKNKLIPWLKSQGCKAERLDWNW